MMVLEKKDIHTTTHSPFGMYKHRPLMPVASFVKHVEHTFKKKPGIYTKHCLAPAVEQQQEPQCVYCGISFHVVWCEGQLTVVVIIGVVVEHSLFLHVPSSSSSPAEEGKYTVITRRRRRPQRRWQQTPFLLSFLYVKRRESLLLVPLTVSVSTSQSQSVSLNVRRTLTAPLLPPLFKIATTHAEA